MRLTVLVEEVLPYPLAKRFGVVLPNVGDGGEPDSLVTFSLWIFRGELDVATKGLPSFAWLRHDWSKGCENNIKWESVFLSRVEWQGFFCKTQRKTS